MHQHDGKICMQVTYYLGSKARGRSAQLCHGPSFLLAEGVTIYSTSGNQWDRDDVDLLLQYREPPFFQGMTLLTVASVVLALKLLGSQSRVALNRRGRRTTAAVCRRCPEPRIVGMPSPCGAIPVFMLRISSQGKPR